MKKQVEDRLPNSAKYVKDNLVPYRLCNRCGSHVLKSELDEYPYQCMYCDEDLFEFETHLMDEKKEISDFDFEDLIEQTNACLCLDEDEE